MIGRAQKPTLRTHPNVRYRKATPARRPAKSPMRPMITGTTAPPMIPVLRIPANGPWCSETEFSANETNTGHIMEAKRPMAGNAISDTRAGPNSAAVEAHLEQVIERILGHIGLTRLVGFARQSRIVFAVGEKDLLPIVGEFGPHEAPLGHVARQATHFRL